MKRWPRTIIHSEHLALLDRLAFTSDGGKYGQGLIQGERTLSPEEWFYANHFYQDPVMPGSLGVEAIVQGIWAHLRRLADKVKFTRPVIDFSSDRPLRWKYRGQVLPASRKIRFEIHLKNISAPAPELQLLADADFWVDDLKIYSIENISISMREGQAL